MTSEKADVYRAKEKIGTITRTKMGSIFEYEQSFLANLDGTEKNEGAAVHLPYSQKKFETRGVNLHPFSAGLLPEGLRLHALIKTIKTSEDDLLSLLIAAGSDCIGDIYVLPSDQSRPRSHSLVDINKLNTLSFTELFQKSISIQEGPDPINIPGVQNKVSASMITFPLRGKKNFHSYILKLNPSDKPLLVQNEFFFLAMAEECGIQVNESELVKDQSGEPGLLVKRFDRLLVQGSEELLSIHQEDACQFLDRYPADKYLIPMSEIATGLQLCSTPILEVGKLIRLYAFSYLIANGDLHAKNISISSSPMKNRTEVTPAYDLLTTLPYGDSKMALKLDGKDDNLRRKNFVEFGKRFEVKEKATHQILDEICDVSQNWIHRLEEIGFNSKQTDHLRRTLLKRRDELASRA